MLIAAGCLSGGSVPSGTRPMLVTVMNESHAPVVLEVAIVGLAGGEPRPVGQAAWVGVAKPGTVPPGATQVVTFFVPTGPDWAIYANGAELMGSMDVGTRSGLELGIDVRPDGASWSCRTIAPGATCP